VSRLGIGSSFGVPTASIERAFHEYGVNYLYWGSVRRGGMKQAIRNLARTDRGRLVVALQSYDRTGSLMRFSCERGLRALGVDHADVLILGWHNRYPSRWVLDSALRLKEKGQVRFLALSGHRRGLFREMAQQAGSPIDVFMIRYSAAHRGAEPQVFPHLPDANRPGTTCYTATRWGRLLDPRKMPPGERPLTASECYRFVLANPHVDLCISGPADASQMNQALQALDDGPLPENELQRIRRIGDHVHG
jgi:aryl-alcohol dehydrogenase-like predicted oxidoreductase